MKIPNDVREALVVVARNWVLERYIGGRAKLTDGSEKLGYIRIFSTSIEPNNSAKGLKRLRKLVEAGVMFEEPRAYHSMVRFAASLEETQKIIDEAVAYWQEHGYEIGVMQDRIGES